VTKQLALDIAERAVWTFLQAFAGAFVVADLTTAKTAALAGLAAVLSLVKGLAASRLGDPSAALP
jgi:hypothetical protein